MKLENTKYRLPRIAILFLDALDYSFEMAKFQKYEIDSVISLLEENIGLKENEYETNAVRLVQTLWGLIDTGYRIRELVQQLPGLKKNSSVLQLFLRHTETVEYFRHYIQHLRSGINTLPEKSTPLWGVISWVSNNDKDTCFTLLTGFAPDVSAYSCAYDIQNNAFAQRLILSVNNKTVEVCQLAEQLKSLDAFIRKWAEERNYSFERRRLPLLKFTVPKA